MKTSANELLTHYAGRKLTTAHLTKVRLRDGEELGFTTFHRDLLRLDSEADGIVYKAGAALEASEIEGKNGLEVPNHEVHGAIDGTMFVTTDIEAGRWQRARVELMRCNWADMTKRPEILFVGYAGEIFHDGRNLRLEVRGIGAALSNELNRVLLPTCDTRFGDERCDPGGALGLKYTHTFLETIVSVESSAAITLTNTMVVGDGDYDDGEIEFIDGPLIGQVWDVRSWLETGEMTMKIPLPLLPEVGNVVSVTRGCNKRDGRRDTGGHCLNRYNNLINFQGFADIKGQDNLLETGFE